MQQLAYSRNEYLFVTGQIGANIYACKGICLRESKTMQKKIGACRNVITELRS